MGTTSVRPARAAGALFLMVSSVMAVACVSPGPTEPENKKGAPAAPTPEPPRAAFTVDPAAHYNLIAVGAHKCVQPAGQSNATGMRMQIATCDGSKAQQFRLQSMPGNYVAIVNMLSDLCIDVAGASAENGADVVQYACHSSPNQQWVLADAPEGNLRLVARHSGRSLDVQGATSAEGTGLIQWPWSGDANQRFKLAVAKDAPDAGAVAVAGKDGGAAVAAKGKEKDKGGAKKKKPAAPK